MGEGGRMWGGIVPLFLKENQELTKNQHKLPHIHKVGTSVSPYLKTPKPTYQIRHTTHPYVRDCVSVCAGVRLYMYIIPQIIISDSATCIMLREEEYSLCSSFGTGERFNMFDKRCN